MDNVNEKFEYIIKYIKDSDEYKNYWNLYDKVKRNDKISKLIIEVKDIQKRIVRKEYSKESLDNLEKELSLKLEELDGIPLYVDFINNQKKLNLELTLIKEKIENYFIELKGGNSDVH